MDVQFGHQVLPVLVNVLWAYIQNFCDGRAAKVLGKEPKDLFLSIRRRIVNRHALAIRHVLKGHENLKWITLITTKLRHCVDTESDVSVRPRQRYPHHHIVYRSTCAEGDPVGVFRFGELRSIFVDNFREELCRFSSLHLVY